MLSRDELGRKIVEVARGHADGYRRNISDHNTAEENVIAERCSVAASNTGYFLLQALGYTSDEMKRLRDEAN